MYLNGRIVPIVGRVSMDMLTVDLGADVVAKTEWAMRRFFGVLSCRLNLVAKYSGILSHELITKLTPRVLTEYVD